MADRGTNPSKLGPNGLRYVLPNQKTAPYQPYAESPTVIQPAQSSAVYDYRDYNKGAHTGYQSSAPGNASGGSINPSQVAKAQQDVPIVNPGVGRSLAGGLGDYATYSVAGMDAPVGMDQAAYNAATANGNIAGLTQNNPGFGSGLAGTLQNKDLMSGVSLGMGALSTGYDIYDKMWGDGAKAKKASIANQNAQTAYNQNALEHKKAFRSGLASASLSGGA